MKKYLLQYPHGNIGAVATDSYAEAANLAARTATGPIPATPVEFMPVAEHLSAIDQAQGMIIAAELAAMEAKAEARALREALNKVSAKVDAIIDGMENNKGLYIATLS